MATATLRSQPAQDAYGAASYAPQTQIIFVDNITGVDPTGTTDSTAAIRTVQQAQGSNPYMLKFGIGTYMLGNAGVDLLQFSRLQGLEGIGSSVTTLSYYGSGNGLYFLDSSFNSSYSFAGALDKFTLDMSHSQIGATGILWGDLKGQRTYDLTIQRGSKANVTAMYYKNITAYAEENHAKIRFLNNTNAVIFENGSFDYSVYDFFIYAGPNQNGITFNNAYADGCRGTVIGNFGSSTSSTNTGYVLGLDPNGGGTSGTSHVNGGEWTFACESDTSIGSGALGHTSVIMQGASSTFNVAGSMKFITAGGCVAFQDPVVSSGSLWFTPNDGQSKGVADALSVRGLIARRASERTASSGAIAISATEVQTLYLGAGSNTVSFSTALTAGTASSRTVDLYLVQPSAGNATVVWPSTVNWENMNSLLSSPNAISHVRLTWLPAKAIWQAVNLSSGTIASSLTNGSFEPHLRPNGWFCESFSRDLGIGSTTQAGPASGTLRMAAVWLSTGTVISNLNTSNGGTSGAGVTNWWLGLYDNNLNQLALTANSTATIAVSANISAAIATTAAGASTSFTTTYTGWHYIGFMYAGTQVPSIVARPITESSANLTPLFAGTSDTGQTSPPAFPHQAAALTSSMKIYVGAS